MNEQLNQLQEKMEDNIMNNENSKAIIESMQDTFENIIKYATDESNKELISYELQRVEARTISFFSMLNSTLQKSNQINSEAIETLNNIKQANEENTKVLS